VVKQPRLRNNPEDGRIKYSNFLLQTQFLGPFAKLQKATISFFMSVRMEELGSHWTDFDET
jgi:hypothetical protein